MEHLRDSSSYPDTPSKQSYIGSYYLPPEKLPRQPSDLRDGLAPKPPRISSQSAPEADADAGAGSRAVIAALKTLQEKMRRLELERAQAERNVEKFSQSSQCYSISKTWTEQQLSTKNGETSQRKELASQLHSAEARCFLLEKQLDYMRKMAEETQKERINTAEREKSTQPNERLRTDLQIQAQLQKLERLEKEYLKLTSTQSVAERKIELLERKLLEEEHQRKLVQEKAEELQRELEANLLMLETAEVKPKKKNKDKASSKKSVKTDVSVPRRLPKANRMPFVAGTSTSPSHSVNGTVQSVLHLLKTREPRLCERVRSMQTASSRKTPFSPCDGAAALGSLSELLLGLQDELGQMSFEHQELVRQIDETNKRELKEDLERELDCLVQRMEEKAAQISKLRKHQQTVQKLSQTSPKKKQKARTSSCSVAVVKAVPPSPTKVSPSTSQERLKLLREAKKLRTNLCKQDVCWET